MKLYKLKWLLYFFAYRLNRWLGGITKWERRDPQAYSTMSWEGCMMFNDFKEVRRLLGVNLHPVLFKIIHNFMRGPRREDR